MTDQLSYEAASNWAKNNDIKTMGQWNERRIKGALPPNVPKNPNDTYKAQWQGWSIFLQNGRRPSSQITKSYEECKKWAQENNIQTAKQWYTLGERLPTGMPVTPDRIFKEWVSWPDFLGTNHFNGISIIERVTRLVLDTVFEPKADEHRNQFALGFSQKKYRVDMLYSRVKLIVEYDGQFYHLEKEQQDILKTQDLQNAGWNVIRIREGKLKKLNETWDVHVNKQRYQEEKVQVVLHHIKLLGENGYLKINFAQTKRLNNLIEHLDLHPYFQKMSDHNEFVTYEECKRWAISHNVSGEAQWRAVRKEMCKKGVAIDKIPANPERTYKNNGWVNWPTFLGNGQRSKKENWASYEQASKWAQQNKIKTAREWYRLGNKRPSNMPSVPENTYKNQWVNWPTFLKNGKTPNGSFVSYGEASLWAKTNSIKTGAQWLALKNKPENIPSYPDNVYIEEWVGWAAFLGVEPYRGKMPTKKKVRKRVTERKFNFVSYEECAIWAKNNGIKISKDWKKIKNRPSNIPSDPPKVYKNVWVSWPAFLGKIYL